MFLKELAERLNYVRREVLSKYNVGELGQEWYVFLKQFHGIPSTLISGTSQGIGPSAPYSANLRSSYFHRQASRRKWQTAVDHGHDGA